MSNVSLKRKEVVQAFSSIMLLAFIVLIACGAYFQINMEIIFVYLCITVVLALKKINIIVNQLINNKIMLIWCMFIVIGIVSTVLMGRMQNLSTSIVEISIFFIVFVLTTEWDVELFLRMYRTFILLLCILAIAARVIDIDFFYFLKEGTVYTSIDPNTGGISTLFEFRHYYGCFLAVALFIQICYPYKRKLLNIGAIGCIVLNIILTYTRNIWITIILCGFLYIIMKRKFKRKNLIIGCIGILILLIASIIFFDKISGIVFNIIERIVLIFAPDSGSFGGVRAYTFSNGIGYIIDNWEQYIWIGGGNGFAMEWLKNNPYEWWSVAIDCQYVTTFMDTGILGIGMLLMMIISIGAKFFTSLDKREKMFAISLLAISCAMAFFEIIGTCTSVFVLWNICLCGLKRDKSNE